MGSQPDTDVEVKVITLGTAGGPHWWREEDAENLKIRFGISTAIVVGHDVYLVDAGYGAAYQLARAGYSMRQVRAIFLTHLHSDHTADLPAILLFGLYETTGNAHLPIPILGPTSCRIEADRTGGRGLFGGHVNGVQGMVENIERAFDADLFDRKEHGGRTGRQLFTVRELGQHNAASHSSIVEVYSDEFVTVRTTPVDHATMKPAFAFRFDTPKGSVTISGDTAPCDALVELAEGSKILLHEAIDQDWMDTMYPPGRDLDAVQQASLAHHQESHSTVSEACDVADRANAKRLILHHLVPGNIPTSAWLAAAGRRRGEVAIAEDLEVFTL